MSLTLAANVGKNCPNIPEDVKALHQCLLAIGKIARSDCDGAMTQAILDGIVAVQRHFMRQPDVSISVGGTTHKFLDKWRAKPIEIDVRLLGALHEAWDWVNPLLPEGSKCTSGYRDDAEQRQILHDFFRGEQRSDIIAIYGKAKYDEVNADLVANEAKVVEMVNRSGQDIAAPGRSAHQRGKAIDIDGWSSAVERFRVVQLVANAHRELFNPHRTRLERNGCVHVEIN